MKRILGAMLVNIDDIEVVEAHSRRMVGWLKLLTRISAQGCMFEYYTLKLFLELAVTDASNVVSRLIV